MVSLSYAQRLSVTVRMLLVGLLLMAMSMVEAQTTSAKAPATPQQTALKNHRHKLHRIHGWLLCLGWGFFIPAGIVVASFRTMTKLGSSWWYYVHVVFASAGFLATLAGIAVGCYFPADNALMVQHKIIGIVVTAAGGLQVILALAVRPPKTSMLRRSWNLMHWTLGRAVLALAIANIFIGCYLSHVKHSHIAAQAVVLGGLFIIYMLKNDIEYMLIKHTPAEEERLMAAVTKPGAEKYCVQMADMTKGKKPSAANGHTNGDAKGTNGTVTMV